VSPSPRLFDPRAQPFHRFRLDLADAFARQPERLADGGERHRWGAVETETSHDDSAPLRGERIRRVGDERGVFGSDQRVQRRARHRVDEHVLPTERASGADRLVERDVVAFAGFPLLRDGPAHDAGVPRDERLHAAPRPPRRVGQETRAVQRVEPQRRFEQSEAAFGFQVVARNAGVQEFPGQPGHVMEPGLHRDPGFVYFF